MTDLRFPIRPAGADKKRAVRTQLGALCYRLHDGRAEVLLVTSRGTGRWVIPKGWPMGGKTIGDAALQEAWEEAGVIGKRTGGALGVYSYVKRPSGDALPCMVAVFPIRVKRLEKRFPEAGERRRKWFEPVGAAARVAEPELGQMLARFDPARL